MNAFKKEYVQRLSRDGHIVGYYHNVFDNEQHKYITYWSTDLDSSVRLTAPPEYDTVDVGIYCEQWFFERDLVSVKNRDGEDIILRGEISLDEGSGFNISGTKADNGDVFIESLPYIIYYHRPARFVTVIGNRYE